MKLIRLAHLGNQEGLFNNVFNEDILIKKGSKIGLQSLFLKREISNLTIKQGDVLFEISYYGNADKSGHIETIQAKAKSDYYITSNNYETLRQTLELALGNGIYNYDPDTGAFNDYIVGLNPIVNIDSKNFVSLNLIKAKITNSNLELSDKVQKTGDFYINNGGVDGVYDKFLYADNELGLATTLIRCKLGGINSATVDKGLIIGYTDKQVNKNSNKLDYSVITFGLVIYNDGGTYKGEIIKNGYLTGTEVDVVAGPDGPGNVSDIIEISVDGYDSSIRAYSDGVADPVLLHSDTNFDNSSTSEKFFLCSFANNADGIGEISYILDETPGYTTTLHSSLYALPPNQIRSQIYAELSFDDDNLADTLGFKDYDELVYDGFDWLFEADKKISLSDRNFGYIVELENIPLQCYDGYKEGRKSIIAVPMMEHTEQEFNFYSPHNPEFYNFNYDGDLLIRELRLRVLNLDYKPISTTGWSQCVLVIKDPQE